MKQITENVTVVMLDASTYTGRQALSKTEKQSAGVTAPEEIMSVGFKKVVSPEAVRPFATLKKAAERILYQYGVRFLGGWAIPNDRVKEALAEVRQLQEEYGKEKARFLANYTRYVREWASAHKDWASFIGSGHTPEALERSLHFGFSAVAIAPVDVEGSDIESEVNGIGARALMEVSKEALSLWDKSLKGKDRITQKTLRPVHKMIEKLDSLSFVDGRLTPLVDHVRGVLDQLPKAGPMDGPDLAAVAGIVLTLSRGDGMLMKRTEKKPAVAKPEVANEAPKVESSKAQEPAAQAPQKPQEPAKPVQKPQEPAQPARPVQPASKPASIPVGAWF